MTRKGLPKFVYEDRGYLQFIRRARGLSVMMKEEFGTPEFWDHYNRLIKGREPVPVKRTIETLALSYFESDAFKKLKPRTQADYRKYIEHIRRTWGDKNRRSSKPITSMPCIGRMQSTGGRRTIWCRYLSSF